MASAGFEQLCEVTNSSGVSAVAIYQSRIIIFVQTGCLFQLKQDPENSLPSPCIPHGYDQATMLGFSWVQWRAFMSLKLETRLKSSNKKTYMPNNKYNLHIHIICINITLYYPSRHSPNYDEFTSTSATGGSMADSSGWYHPRAIGHGLRVDVTTSSTTS